MASAEMAAMLDELMGKYRNVDPTKRPKSPRWDDDDVCKHFLAGYCPNELFVNTRSDIGPCRKTHDEHMREQYKKSSRFGKMGYEEDFLAFLTRLQNDMARKIRKNRDRLELTQPSGEVATMEKERIEEKLIVLSEKINVLIVQAEQLGAEGKVEEAQGVIKMCDDMKEERDQLKRVIEQQQIDQQNKDMEVCDICACFLVVNDAPQRIDEHLSGKQHIGFAKIKVTIDEILRVKEEERKKRLGVGSSDDKGRDGRSRDRDHRSRDPERKDHDSHDRGHRSSRDEKNAKRSSRDRDRDRGAKRSSRDRERDSKRSVRDISSRTSRDKRERSRDRLKKSSRDRSRSHERSRHSRKRSKERASSRKRSKERGTSRKRSRERESSRRRSSKERREHSSRHREDCYRKSRDKSKEREPKSNGEDRKSRDRSGEKKPGTHKRRSSRDRSRQRDHSSRDNSSDKERPTKSRRKERAESDSDSRKAGSDAEESNQPGSGHFKPAFDASDPEVKTEVVENQELPSLAAPAEAGEKPENENSPCHSGLGLFNGLGELKTEESLSVTKSSIGETVPPPPSGIDNGESAESNEHPVSLPGDEKDDLPTFP